MNHKKQKNNASSIWEECNQQKAEEACEYIIELMKCALNNLPMKEKSEDCNWSVIYKLISKNNIQGLTYYAVEKIKDRVPEVIMKEWKQYRDAVIYKKLMREEERNIIMNDLSKEGISFLPLKGCNIDIYYPELGMRDMADNDILYGKIGPGKQGEYCVLGRTEDERKQTVRETQKILLSYMQNRGYKTSGEREKDDVCEKDDIYNFEMHRDLMDLELDLYEYYKNPWKRAIPDEGSEYLYHFSKEDEYIFMIAHEYKHYSGRGCGIRYLADIYMFLQKEQQLDWEYICEELEKMKIREFEEQMRRLSVDALRPEGILTEEEKKSIYAMCGYGTFGHSRTALQRQIKGMTKGNQSLKKAKIKYYLLRFLPPDEFYKRRYPFFYKHRLLRPILSVYRTTKGVLFHSKHLKKEMKDVLETK